uniref:Alpha-amylase n=1 Tax=Rhabditophanes sp. KR3021 TaxID=114890 RepID=A0AC35UFV4_9BILA
MDGMTMAQQDVWNQMGCEGRSFDLKPDGKDDDVVYGRKFNDNGTLRKSNDSQMAFLILKLPPKPSLLP